MKSSQSVYLESGNLDGLEAVESLIANVGGWLLMLQKDKASPEKDKKSRKVGKINLFILKL
jgi:hypothetical protein